MITDKNMVKLSGELVETVKGAGYEVKTWDGAEPEPSTKGAIEASGVLKEFKPQLVIGFGGGGVAEAAFFNYSQRQVVALLALGVL